MVVIGSKELKLTENSITEVHDGYTLTAYAFENFNENLEKLSNSDLVELPQLYKNISVAKFHGRLVYNTENEQVGIAVLNVESDEEGSLWLVPGFFDDNGNDWTTVLITERSFIVVDEDDGDDIEDTNIYYIVSRKS